MTTQPVAPAAELAKKNGARFPNESPEYRVARDKLLAEEIGPGRHIERVAEQRRALPPGGVVAKSSRFVGESGPAVFADMFGDRQTPLWTILDSNRKDAAPTGRQSSSIRSNGGHAGTRGACETRTSKPERFG